MPTKEQNREYQRKWYQQHAEEQKARRKSRYQTEAYRAKRRADYRIKHANDPMTEHRRRCIEAQEKRMRLTREEREAKKMEKLAEQTAKQDMIESGFMQAEEAKERKRTRLIRFINEWSKRNMTGVTTIKNGEDLSEADVIAYHRDACKYVELEKKMSETNPRDYSTRNNIGYRMRVLESRFGELLNKKYPTKKRI